MVETSRIYELQMGLYKHGCTAARAGFQMENRLIPGAPEIHKNTLLFPHTVLCRKLLLERAYKHRLYRAILCEQHISVEGEGKNYPYRKQLRWKKDRQQYNNLEVFYFT